MNLKWTKIFIKEYSLVVDALIIYDLVDTCGDKLPNKLKMKMVITILGKWPNNCKLN